MLHECTCSECRTAISDFWVIKLFIYAWYSEGIHGRCWIVGGIKPPCYYTWLFVKINNFAVEQFEVALYWRRRESNSAHAIIIEKLCALLFLGEETHFSLFFPPVLLRVSECPGEGLVCPQRSTGDTGAHRERFTHWPWHWPVRDWGWLTEALISLVPMLAVGWVCSGKSKEL